MGQGTEPVEVQTVEGVGGETHHTLLLFVLPVIRSRSYRSPENSISFFSVVAHCSTPRFLDAGGRLSYNSMVCWCRWSKRRMVQRVLLAEVQYLLRYGGERPRVPPFHRPIERAMGTAPTCLIGHFVGIQRLAGKSNGQSAWRMVG